MAFGLSFAAAQESTRPSNVKLNIDANTTQIKVNTCIEMSMIAAKVSTDVSIVPAIQQVVQEFLTAWDSQLPTIPEPRDQHGPYRFIWKGSNPADPRNMDVMLKNIDDEKFGIQANN
ncbi:Hypothetical predicted protein [Mytilus galloprovincialis]|uniref:Uncharacterized protein n=1 Tax=Mytilus galloprovincialis TaxID=29158 RepID=A0A8B6EUK9_MYTGA|nr:Hypothetical predicted protein [Mytilus galloprovincialis]